MEYKSLKYCLIILIFILISATNIFSKDDSSLIEATPAIRAYAKNTVKPLLDTYPKRDKLSLLLKVSDILIDDETGVHINEISPAIYIVYDKLDTIGLGFLMTFTLTSEQKQILKAWHSKFMQKNPADVFFAPSADEIIRRKAAFGCTHYARSFIAVVKALGIVNDPKEMRYVVSSKSDDYNKAMAKMDSKMTINGHQFVLVNIDSKWIAINTSKSEYTVMPEAFSPDNLNPPQNIPIQFESYPDVTFLLRKIGKDYNDDCDDNSLSALMNISRSGNSQLSDFKWEKYVPPK